MFELTNIRKTTRTSNTLDYRNQNYNWVFSPFGEFLDEE